MAQISNTRGSLAELTTSRFSRIEVSVMHLSERHLTSLKHCSKHHLNQKLGFSLALLKSLLLPFYSQGCLQSSAPVPQGAD